jgi:hypothetical protein
MNPNKNIKKIKQPNISNFFCPLFQDNQKNQKSKKKIKTPKKN